MRLLSSTSPEPWFLDRSTDGFHTIRCSASSSPIYNPAIAQVWDHHTTGRFDAALFFHSAELARLVEDVSKVEDPFRQQALDLLAKMERTAKWKEQQ